MIYRFPQSRDWFEQSMDEELHVFDLWECKPLTRRDSRVLASISTRLVAIAQQATITMQTEVEQR